MILEKVRELWKEHIEPYNNTSIFSIFHKGFVLGEMRGYRSFQIELRNLKMNLENHEYSKEELIETLSDWIEDEV